MGYTYELREDGSYELREDGSYELREGFPDPGYTSLFHAFSGFNLGQIPIVAGTGFYFLLLGGCQVSLQKNVASQKVLVFAWNRSTGAPATGEAANITATIRLDSGAFNPTSDTNPTEIGSGYYEFDLSQAESNADGIDFIPVCSTSGIQVMAAGGGGHLQTVPPDFADEALSTASALSNLDGDVAVNYATLLAVLDDTGTQIPASLTTIEGKIDTIDGIADAILVDTGTDLPFNQTVLDGKLDSILEDTGTTLPATLTSIEGKVDTVDTVVDAVLVDTGTTIPATLAALPAAVWAYVIVTTRSAGWLLNKLATVLFGTGVFTSPDTKKYTGLGGATDYVQGTEDSAGNRSDITFGD